MNHAERGETYDLAIVGSGGAAFAAAIAARRRDLSVVMIEQGTVGGTCVNVGCVPSKALLAAAEARHMALDDRFAGIRTSARPADLPTLVGAKRELVDMLRAEKYVDLAAEYGWRIVHRSARFAGEELEELPTSMLVVGGNAVGLELAQLFARLGVDVTVVEVLDRLAPYEEPEISQTIERVFADEGISVVTAATVKHIARNGPAYSVAVEADGEDVVLGTDQLLVATGRRPATAGLAFDTVGVKVGDRGQVVVDDHLRSTNPRVWAAGDVTGHPQLVYVAAAHGAMIVENAFDRAERAVEYEHLPRVTFTSPAIASVGLTDAEAVETGLRCECRVLPLEHVPRAIVNRDPRGVVKIVAERRTGRIRGIHMIGDGAQDAILAGTYAIQSGMTTQQMAATWAPYLTMSEGLRLAAQAFTRDVSMLSCCAA
ncbi:MAG: FAD-binding protein [Propionibacteriales bacterium]|nr:FAD-binding protein [Propionibacteriales bacterium]